MQPLSEGRYWFVTVDITVVNSLILLVTDTDDIFRTCFFYIYCICVVLMLYQWQI